MPASTGGWLGGLPPGILIFRKLREKAIGDRHVAIGRAVWDVTKAPFWLRFGGRTSTSPLARTQVLHGDWLDRRKGSGSVAGPIRILHVFARKKWLSRGFFVAGYSATTLNRGFFVVRYSSLGLLPPRFFAFASNAEGHFSRFFAFWIPRAFIPPPASPEPRPRPPLPKARGEEGPGRPTPGLFGNEMPPALF